MLRNRLKDIDLRITELADYLHVSRPTMYKFIDYYDNEKYELINNKVLNLFNYINENELAGKKTVVNYILNNLVVIDDESLGNISPYYNKIRDYIITNPNSKKTQFYEIISNGNIFDDILFYLVDVAKVLNKKKNSKKDLEFLEKYNKILELIRNVEQK